MMPQDKFRDIVNRMRMAQRRVARNQSPQAKEEAARLEKIVDDDLRETLPDESGFTQPGLFGGGDA